MTGVCYCQDWTVELIIRSIDLDRRVNATRDQNIAQLETEIEAMRTTIRALQCELSELDRIRQATIIIIAMVILLRPR